MKLLTLAAAGLVAFTGFAPAAMMAQASAQRTVVHERTVVRHNDSRPGIRHRTRTRQVCRNVVRNHHRQRVCRTVRVSR
jgi:uncharacterized protein YcfJ